MSPTQLQLTSVNFGDLSQNIISGLRNDFDFHDVTLICDGDQQIKAHKVVLASVSQFFKNILTKNPHQHPLIYLKGVIMKDLKAIVDFIYRGEITIDQESLENMLQLSRDLEIRGIIEDQNVMGKIVGHIEKESDSTHCHIIGS